VRVKAFNLNFSEVLTKCEENHRDTAPLNGIRTHGPAITGALLYQLSHQANWELVIMRFRNIYTNCLSD